MIELDQRLASDTHLLGWLASTRVLLMDNALVPWLVLVPTTLHTELFDLPQLEQKELSDQVRDAAGFLREHFAVDKLNVAAIGNVVSQLHVHIVGRRRDDFCWPDVVWGQSQRKPWAAAEVSRLRASATRALGLQDVSA